MISETLTVRHSNNPDDWRDIIANRGMKALFYSGRFGMASGDAADLPVGDWREVSEREAFEIEEENRRTMFDTEEAATAALRDGEIVADHGPAVWPRFAIIVRPAVGDPVSYGFNGDYYPDGHITYVGTSLREIRTSTGNTYYRRKKSAAWIKKGGTWGLVRGHIDRRNPEF